MSEIKERVVHDTITMIQEVHDTITNVVHDTIWVLNAPPTDTGLFKKEIAVGDILTILGFCITYYLFWRQIKEARKDYRTNQRDSWMLNVVIQPYIENLNEMYANLTTLVDKEVKQLKEKPVKGDKAKRINDIAKLKRKLKVLINDFYDPFVNLLGATDKHTASSVESLASDLIDISTSLIDNHAEYKDIQTVRRPILDNKQKVVAALYASMKSDDAGCTRDQ